MKINDLPICATSLILSFVSPEAPSAVSRQFKACSEAARAVWGYEQIRSAPNGSLISRLMANVQHKPSERSRLVKKVRSSAAGLIQEYRQNLLPNDYAHLGIAPSTPIHEYSVDQMNYAWERICNNGKDLTLIEAFHQIFLLHPEIEASIALPDHQLFETTGPSYEASLLRRWIQDPANQQFLPLVQEIELEALSEIPVELIHFPNISREDLFDRALDTQSWDTIQALLQNGTVLPPPYFGKALLQAIEAGKNQIVSLLLQNPYEIPPRDVGHALLDALAAGNQELFLQLLGSAHPIDPKLYGEALVQAYANRRREIARSLLTQNRPIDPELLGEALKNAAGINDREFVQLILGGPRPIDPTLMGRALESAANNHHWPLFHLILSSARPINPLRLGYVLKGAALENDSGLIHSLLDSGRPIDQNLLGEALVHAVEHGNLLLTRLLLQKQIKPAHLGQALAIAHREKFGEIKQELLKYRQPLLSRISTVARGVFNHLFKD